MLLSRVPLRTSMYDQDDIKKRIEQVRQSHALFQKKVSTLSQRENKLLREIQALLDKAKIDEALKRLAQSKKR